MFYFDTNPLKLKLFTNATSLEQTKQFKYLGYDLTYNYSKDVEEQ